MCIIYGGYFIFAFFIIEMNKLIFDSKFDCIVALNSKLPPLAFFIKYFKDTPIIGADGGAVQLFNLGIICDFVVGDLDTFHQAKIETFFQKKQIIHNPDQEINDFEKALIFANEQGYQNILIVGFHGGELEHTLNNWSILKKFQNRKNLCVYERGRYAIPLSVPFELETHFGEMISIIPQPFVKLSTKNLLWNLNNETLELGSREGARNVATDNYISINILEGSILLFIDERLPHCYRIEEKSGPDETRTHDL
ncbi:thiamine diphosphokinase [Bacteroidetes/Chlorobi group bacterium Naka2016]|nr:MAG: thiamine diphosphokinase [Bacteroidetes/Chlorobi group bacterium Naka2016]